MLQGDKYLVVMPFLNEKKIKSLENFSVLLNFYIK
jgi:hypothetical protein